MRKISLLTILFAFPAIAIAAEGMWTLDNLPTARLQAGYNFTPTTAWTNRMMQGSARIAGGCSASFISKDGLVMTNHHCASECVDQLSSASKNYMQDGFLARQREQEVRCPEIELNRLELITDVTSQVKEATRGLQGAAFKAAQNEINATLASACIGKERETVRCDVVDLYHGGRYHLYRYHRFQDTRLVWVPEKDSAFFGGDPDNFNFPRFDLDIALVRAYENGKPAAITNFLPFSKNGAADNELVFVTGHPGSTQRQLTMAQLDTIRDLGLIGDLLELAELRGVLEQFGKASAEAARISEGTLFGVENSYKAMFGELTALLDPALRERKLAEETELRRYTAASSTLATTVSPAWDAIAAAQQAYRQLEKPYAMIERGRAFNSTYFDSARLLVRAARERGLPNGQRLPNFTDGKLPELEQQLFSSAPVYPEFEKVKLGFSLTKLRERLGSDHPLVKQVLGRQSPDQLAAALIATTRLGEIAVRKALWDGGQAAIERSDDPFIRLALAIDPAARALRKDYEREVETIVQRNSELIAQARFAQRGTGDYPDATFTLRLSYGEVQGWEEAGKPVAPFTTIGGAFERDTGVAPFALPASWLAAKPRLKLAQPFNFSTTNDIIGGNSGSPMVNRNGEIVGLIFDGNIHSLGGAFWFDPRVNRAVAVHSGAILETLSVIYGATALVREIRPD